VLASSTDVTTGPESLRNNRWLGSRRGTRRIRVVQYNGGSHRLYVFRLRGTHFRCQHGVIAAFRKIPMLCRFARPTLEKAIAAACLVPGFQHPVDELSPRLVLARMFFHTDGSPISRQFLCHRAGGHPHFDTGHNGPIWWSTCAGRLLTVLGNLRRRASVAESQRLSNRLNPASPVCKSGPEFLPRMFGYMAKAMIAISGSGIVNAAPPAFAAAPGNAPAT